MKLSYTTLAFAFSAALVSLSTHAQTTQQGQATPPMQSAQPPAQEAPNAQQTQPIRPDTPQAAPAADNAGQDMTLPQEDQKFLEDAVQGSYAEIEGSQLALEKTENAEVRQFAEMMIADHQQMVEETSTLAREKGMAPPDGPSVMQRTEITSLKVLTGGAFDAMYVNRIGVAAHESTIEMFEQAGQEVRDPDIKALITETLPKLREHLQMAQTLNEKQDNE